MVRPRDWGRRVWVTFGACASLLVPAIVSAAPLDAMQADRLRIQQHLEEVEERLRQAPVDALSPSARFARARLLDELHDYWQAGIFPRNSKHVGELRPYFIDDEGRPCAVGALIIRSGSEALAERIDRTFHTDYVPDMQDAELKAWSEANGFSVAELALIQPTYCNCDGTDYGSEAGGAGGGGGAGTVDYFQPVCGSNGLTYWNQCIAELCGGVTVVATGKCERDPPCELCGTGTREAVVSECTNDAPTGICNGIDSQPELVPVNDRVAAHWLELQNADCQDPDYSEPPIETDGPQGWQPAFPVEEHWTCADAGGADGAGGASGAGNDGGEAPRSNAGEAGAEGSAGGSPPSGSSGAPGVGGEPNTSPAIATPEGGCNCAARPTKSGAGLALALLMVGVARRRRRMARERDARADVGVTHSPMRK